MQSIPFYDAAVTATATLLAPGTVELNNVEIENPNLVAVYLQLFDFAAVSSVTLGVTVPTSTRLVPPSDGTTNGARILDFTRPIRFNNGCVYAITTTRNGATAAGNVCFVNFDRS